MPLYYERYGGPVPRRWLKKVRRSLASLGPQVTASRMVADYVTELYEPTGARATALTADGLARARALAAWKARVREGWHGVHVDRVDGELTAADVGGSRAVEAWWRSARSAPTTSTSSSSTAPWARATS